MPSIVPDFEYDIFISYRHNDNHNGGVTEFVDHLKAELATTVKEPLSIYFDSNAHDGLLENHHVNKSLEGKLKCLIFIPIISQTYCDPKSFAWKHEFVAFNSLAKEDAFGRDIKLGNGNVASRILPIKIHDLDKEDTAAIENEIGNVLRAIEFIYREPGVNRPLKVTDKKEDNRNHTDYANQVNKVANAVKEIIAAIKSPGHPLTASVGQQTKYAARAKSGNKKIPIAAAIVLLLVVAGYFLYSSLRSTRGDNNLSKSIAVLPFENLSGEDDAYFTVGVTEDILTQISKISELRVLSRFTLKDYDAKGKTVKEIGEELGVGFLLTGSIRRVGDDLRISCQLVQVNPEQETWAENFDKRMDDVFAIQNEVATEVAKYLKAKLSPEQQNSIAKRPTQNLVAYNHYLQGRVEYGKYEPEAMKKAIVNFQQALKLDPNFALAWAGLADGFSQGVTTFVFLPRSYADSAKDCARKAIDLDPNSAENWKALGLAYRIKGLHDEAIEYYEKAIALNPNYLPAIANLASIMVTENRIDEAIRLQRQAIRINPLDWGTYANLGSCYRLLEMYSDAEAHLQRALVLNPRDRWGHYTSAFLYIVTNQTEKARQHLSDMVAISPDDPGTYEMAADLVLNFDPQLAKIYLKKSREAEGFDTLTNYVTSLGLGYQLWQEGKIESARKWLDPILADHLKQINDGSNNDNIKYQIAINYAIRSEKKEALRWLQKMNNDGVLFDKANYVTDFRLASIQKEPEFTKMMDEIQQKIDAMRLKVSAMEQYNEQ